MEYPLISANVFGPFRYFLKVSPFNCGHGPFRFVFVVFSLAVFLAMVFRSWWMFYMIDVEILSFAWAERNMYAFITMESFSCLIGLYKMTKNDSLAKFEQKMGQLRLLRITPHQEKYDNFGKLRLKSFLLKLPIPVFFIGSAVFLLAKNKILYGTNDKSSWYPYFDAGVMFFCAYVNILYLPIHALLHSGLSREFEVFNEELENFSKNKELMNNSNFQKFADRQLQLFEFTNIMTQRLDPLISSAGALILIGLVNATFLMSNLRTETETLYYICIVGLMVCCIIITSNLLYPPAFVQISMHHTSHVLMNDKFIHHSQDPKIYSIYRTMVDRSEMNRKFNRVAKMFTVNTENIGRSFFVVTQIVLLMVVFHNLLYPQLVK